MKRDPSGGLKRDPPGRRTEFNPAVSATIVATHRPAFDSAFDEAQQRLAKPAVRRRVEEDRAQGRKEAEERSFDRRFGTGVPRVSDGSRLFLLHLVSKMRPTKVGYEIPFNRHFYVFKPQRPLAAIDADLKVVTDKIRAMLEELSQ